MMSMAGHCVCDSAKICFNFENDNDKCMECLHNLALNKDSDNFKKQEKNSGS